MRTLMVSAILLVAAFLAAAQEDTVAKKQLRSPAVARGTVGGEAHDSYIVHAEKGRRWSGKVPKTGDYFIYLVGHPSARYRLRVTVKQSRRPLLPGKM